MIVDTSVIMALLREEPDSRTLLQLMNGAPALSMSAGTHIELTVVITRNLSVAVFERADQILRQFAVAILPVTQEHTQLAREGYVRFGQVSGSPAKLNFGDCFAYALAKATGEPLLFKGADFTHTDVQRAV